MKSAVKFLIILAVTAILSAAFYAFAETAVQLPQEWIEQYAEKFPNSEIGIKHRFPDIPDDWSTDALVKAVQNGLLNGSDGKILPADNLTRAQLATIMVRAFGASEAADVSSFTDLSSDQWFYNDMAKSVKMGIFRGDGSGIIRPNDSITRQEVFTVISRAFAINGSDIAILADFPDGNMVADWASEATASLIAQGYISGSGGYINPQNPITRAEFAQIMKNLVDAYITEEGVYEEVPEGNIIVRAPGVVFSNASFNGDVFVGEGVGKSITFSNCTSEHRVVIRGGKSTVLTGTFANINVVGSDLVINASGATVAECINNTNSTVTLSDNNTKEDDEKLPADDNTEADSEKLPADDNTEADGEKLPADDNTEADGEKLPADDNTEADGEKLPADGNTEADGEKLPADDNTEADGEKLPADDNTEADGEKLPDSETAATDNNDAEEEDEEKKPASKDEDGDGWTDGWY